MYIRPGSSTRTTYPTIFFQGKNYPLHPTGARESEEICSAVYSAFAVLIDYACQRREPLSVLELKSSFSGKRQTGRVTPHDVSYVFIAPDELAVINARKGYAGLESQAALTIDTWIDLLDVPSRSQTLTGRTLASLREIRTVEEPNPRVPAISKKNSERILRRARLSGVHNAYPEVMRTIDELNEYTALVSMSLVEGFQDRPVNLKVSADRRNKEIR